MSPTFNLDSRDTNREIKKCGLKKRNRKALAIKGRARKKIQRHRAPACSKSPWQKNSVIVENGNFGRSWVRKTSLPGALGTDKDEGTESQSCSGQSSRRKLVLPGKEDLGSSSYGHGVRKR